ncbi:hypothetical protein AB0C98_08385 [Streptomyces sp. NPDC048558]|uniref:hypothetical protein n=1 Tax=Streptomyces sp. NPDC048558 TaxID=3155759 RepID=UPI0033C1CFCE
MCIDESARSHAEIDVIIDVTHARQRGGPQPIAVLNIAGAYGCLGVFAYVARLQPLARPVGERPIGG